MNKKNFNLTNTFPNNENEATFLTAYDYTTTYNILKNLYNLTPKEEKLLIIFAGPNGSGKSTLIANLKTKKNFNIKYINADIIAKENFNIDDETERNYASMHYTMWLVNNYISKGFSFCYETVLSHPSKLDIVKNAKENGYKILSVIVKTNSPDINVMRVKKRARQGGHDVPEDKIRDRYYRSLKNIEELKKLSTAFIIINNSKEKTIVHEK